MKIKIWFKFPGPPKGNESYPYPLGKVYDYSFKSIYFYFFNLHIALIFKNHLCQFGIHKWLQRWDYSLNDAPLKQNYCCLYCSKTKI